MKEKETIKATFVFPCLNESKTLGPLLEECHDVFKSEPSIHWNILVADNGSTDNSVEIAKKAGVQVIHVSTKGYGAALHSGITHAKTDWVVYADSDGTYSPKDGIRLVQTAIKNDSQLVLGSRIKGNIQDGAMPWMHRHLGTPVLSFFIRFLYGLDISDCNSGIRCVHRDSYVKWRMKSKGMEFASAILIKAANHHANVAEVPVKLRRGPRGRVPHLKKWRDGMKHLLVILAGAPWFFWQMGLFFLFASLCLCLPCLWGPRHIFENIGIFGPHTLAMGTILGFFGCLLINLSILFYATSSARIPIPKPLAFALEISEDKLFWSLVFFFFVFIGGVGGLFWKWYLVHYGALELVNWALFTVYITIIPLSLVVGVFQGHLAKRTQA